MGRHAHHSPGGWARLFVSRWGLVAVTAAIVLLGALVAPSVSERFAPGCQRTLALRVAADPSIAPAVSALGRRLEGSTVRVEGRCVDVDVRAVPAAAVVGALTGEASSATLTPHVWIPDSSVWLSTAGMSPAAARVLPERSPSVARSPVVLAMPPEVAGAVGWPDDPPSWGTVLGPPAGQAQPAAASAQPAGGQGGMKLGLPDPTRSAAGLLGLTAFQRAAHAQAPRWHRLDRALFVMGLQRAVAADAPDPRSQLSAGVTAFPALEQSVWQVNSRAGDARLVAVYPEEGAPAADFPYAVLHAPSSSALTDAAAGHLRDALTGSTATAVLSEHGLRRPSGGSARFATAEVGLSSDTPAALAPPDADALAETLALWEVADQRGRVLAAIDVSGSMGFPVSGTDDTRMEVARAAGVEVIQLFDRRSELGVWVFSTHLDGDRDHQEVLPVGRLDEPVAGGGTRLDMVVGELSRLQPILGGGTGLYDTALAAFREANDSYKPEALNVVVLLTDGVNDDPDTISRDELVAAVRSEFDPDKPVVFFTFGYGSSSDGAVLEDLAEATGGRFYLSRDPTSIRAAFLDALLDSADLAPPG